MSSISKLANSGSNNNNNNDDNNSTRPKSGNSKTKSQQAAEKLPPKQTRLNLRVMTFNLLAPCYKRMSIEYLEALGYEYEIYSSQLENMMQASMSSDESGMLKNLRIPGLPSADPALQLPKIPVSASVVSSGSSTPDKSDDSSSVALSSSSQDRFATQSSSARKKPRPRESQFDSLWQYRCLETLKFIKSVKNVEIMCLQEFWFHDDYQKYFLRELQPKYNFYQVQRSGLKADGIATLTLRSRITTFVVRKIDLFDAGNRVGLLTLLRIQDEGGNQNNSVLLLVVNIHLTFPHNEYDQGLRLNQMQKTTEYIDGFIEQLSGEETSDLFRSHELLDCAVLIVGDFNGNYEDPVGAHLRCAGYSEAMLSCIPCVYEGKARKSTSPCASDVVTHLTHRHEVIHCDHVWIKQSLNFQTYANNISHRENAEKVSSSAQSKEGENEEQPTNITVWHCRPVTVKVFPMEASLFAWPEEFALSDHRPVLVELELVRMVIRI